jgi:hypothetical protein
MIVDFKTDELLKLINTNVKNEVLSELILEVINAGQVDSQTFTKTLILAFSGIRNKYPFILGDTVKININNISSWKINKEISIEKLNLNPQIPLIKARIVNIDRYQIRTYSILLEMDVYDDNGKEIKITDNFSLANIHANDELGF